MSEWTLAPQALQHGHSRVEAKLGEGCVGAAWDRLLECRFTLFPSLALLSSSG